MHYILRGSHHCWQWNSDKLLILLNIQQKAGDSDTVPLQYVVGVVAWETWNWFRHTVCSPSWAEWQMAWVAFCSQVSQSKATMSWRSLLAWEFWQVYGNLCTHRRLHLRTHAHTHSGKPWWKRFVVPPETNHWCKIHYHRSIVIGGGGASQELQGNVSIHGGTRSLQKQKVKVGEASCTWRALLTGYCGGHTVSRMAAYKWTACKHLLSKHLRQAHF